MLDRTQPPEIHPIDNLNLPMPTIHQLDNGIKVYASNLGSQEIIKLEVLYLAGRPYEHKPLVGRCTNALLKEGSKNYTAAEIAEIMDFYGGTLSTPINLDTSSVTLYSLTKHFDKLLPVFADVLHHPLFPQSELDAFRERNIQRLQIDLAQNDVVAYRDFTEYVYGSDHPYGYNSSEMYYREITRADIVRHYKECFHANNCYVFISGMIDDRCIELLNGYLGQQKSELPKKVYKMAVPVAEPIHKKMKVQGGVQVAVRIGRRLFDRSHPDFTGMYIVNTILGGYFSSRLMNNIREDKGYTYNIFSTLDMMLHDGYFYIGTELGAEFEKPALQEIYKEIELLKTNLVDQEELTMVINYSLGLLMNSVDGAFNVSEVLKTLILEELPITFFDKMIQEVKSITPEKIQALAVKYLDKKDLYEVIVT